MRLAPHRGQSSTSSAIDSSPIHQPSIPPSAQPIQRPRRHRTGWTGPLHAGIVRTMPALNRSDDELQNAAQAARIASVQADQDAGRQTNPNIKAGFETTARKSRELAARFERARNGSF